LHAYVVRKIDTQLLSTRFTNPCHVRCMEGSLYLQTGLTFDSNPDSPRTSTKLARNFRTRKPKPNTNWSHVKTQTRTLTTYANKARPIQP
jgi:hypothetical protein